MRQGRRLSPGLSFLFSLRNSFSTQGICKKICIGIFSLATIHKIFIVRIVKFGFRGIQNLARKTQTACRSLPGDAFHIQGPVGIAVFLAKLSIPCQLGNDLKIFWGQLFAKTSSHIELNILRCFTRHLSSTFQISVSQDEFRKRAQKKLSSNFYTRPFASFSRVTQLVLYFFPSL